MSSPDPHTAVMMSLQGRIITNLMDTLQVIASIARNGPITHPQIAAIAENAIEATKALKFPTTDLETYDGT